MNEGISFVRDSRRAGVWILHRVFQTQSFADILLNHVLENTSLSFKERALATELVYGTLRWFGYIEWILKKLYRGLWKSVPSFIQRNLEVAGYQILFLSKIPAYAIVNEAVEIAKQTHGERWAGMVNAVLRKLIQTKDKVDTFLLDEKSVSQKIAIQWSHPQWLVEKWILRFGVERTVAFCQANNQNPYIGIRVNLQKTTRESLSEEFLRAGIEVERDPFLPEFLRIRKSGDISSLEAFQQGKCTVQDPSAGLVAHLVDPHPGEWILDLTSAPGGKATHLAELSNDQAYIVAVDKYFHRLQRVRENACRLGLSSIHCVAADSTGKWNAIFDKVLLDAPCTSVGIFRRCPELKWKKLENKIPEICQLQSRLLESAAQVVKPGGILVYSTCSVLEEENGERINAFLSQHPEFHIDSVSGKVPEIFISPQGWIETWPDLHDLDGSFAVSLRKRG